MKKYFWLLLLFSAWFGAKIQAQSLDSGAVRYADPQKYLIDSLHWEAITPQERQLIDSALVLYYSAKEDTSRLKAVNLIIEESWDDNVWPKYNRWILEQVEQLIPSKANNSPEVNHFFLTCRAGAINNIGYYHKRHGNIALALKYYHEALRLREECNDIDNLAVSYINLGALYYSQGDDYKALDLYLKALKLQEELNQEELIQTTLNNIGALHKRQKDFDLAIQYYNRSLEWSQKVDDKKGIALIYNNLGVLYSEQQNYEKALEYEQKSLAIREKLGHKRKTALAYNNIGSLYKKLKQYEKALDYYRKSESIYTDIGDKAGLSTCYSNIGMVKLTQGNVDEAGINAEKGLQLAKEVGYPDNIQTAANILTSVYQKQKKFEKALEMHQLHVQMRDSLNNTNSRKEALKKEAGYAYEKQKALDDAEHEKQLAVEKEAKEKQRILAYSAVGGIVLVISFLVFVVHRLRITRRQKNIIEEQKALVDEANEELHQTNEEILAQRDQIELQKNIIENKHTQLQASIRYAKKIQLAVLPKTEQIIKVLPEHFILFKPKDIVSGDFYWADLKGEYLYVAVADCTGHGVPGAFMSMLGLSFLNQINRRPELLSPAEILNELRQNVIRELKQEGKHMETRDGMDIALIRINRNKMELQYAGAYNPLYVINKDRSGLNYEKAKPFKDSTIGWEIKATKRPIGLSYGRKEAPFENHAFQLVKNDLICIFTDGYADQFGGKKEAKFTYSRFREVLVDNSNLNTDQIKTQLSATFKEWRGTESQTDDVCVLGIKI